MYEYGTWLSCSLEEIRGAVHIWDALCFVLLAGPMLLRSGLPPWLALIMGFAFLTEIVLGWGVAHFIAARFV
ncbi:MAG: hypothetical protein ACREX8_01465 [Gammaproteobacteria bacterium]